MEVTLPSAKWVTVVSPSWSESGEESFCWKRDRWLLRRQIGRFAGGYLYGLDKEWYE